MSPANTLQLYGARENNLKDFDLSIPHDHLVVVTGISGSGKSSLAFDTVYAEGQRRYIETFSPYTRQFFDKIKRPDLDRAHHVRPAIAIQQRTRVLNSRSTVGSLTDINDYLKVVWSNLAQPVCPECGRRFERWDADTLAKHLTTRWKLLAEQTWYICAEVHSEDRAHEIERFLALGFNRYLNPESGAIALLDEIAGSTGPGQITVVLERVRGSAVSMQRLRESLSQAFHLGSGVCTIVCPTARRPWLRIDAFGSQGNHRHPPYDLVRYADHPRSNAGTVDFPPARPALFSFNHPIGACERCKGFGKILEIDLNAVVPDGRKSLAEHALHCWSGPRARGEHRRMLRFAEAHGISTNAPWASLPPESQQRILYNRSREYHGVFPWFKRIERKAYKMHVRVFLARYRTQVTCPECGGARLKRTALAYRIDGIAITDLWNMSITEAHVWLHAVAQSRSHPRQMRDVLSATLTRLAYLTQLGLGYLTLDRQARSLSGGETQRVNLATALGSELVSSQFVLDEPSVGLHARDTARLTDALRMLTDRGNSVLVVEHDFDCMSAADRILELGPDAGAAGGTIVFDGDAREWGGIPLTSWQPRAVRPATARLEVRNACARNLKGLSLHIPLQQLVVVTGVSGSGKSTFVHEVLGAAYEQFSRGEPSRAETNQVTGFEAVQQVLTVDQAPLAKTPRANIATYTGVWDVIRDLFAKTEGAEDRGLTKSSFSFNVDGGRCSACSGAGFIREDMQFLSDVFITCEICLGRRFTGRVLEVAYEGKSIHDILVSTGEECRAFFSQLPPDHANARRHGEICKTLEVIEQLGLGHLSLGHSLSELSGGEAQRLKLVPFIRDAHLGPALLIFDEPTTGLHARDVTRLIALLHELCSRGHSAICVEHNLYLISEADWVIDLGPEGGSAGGYLQAAGSPQHFIEEVTDAQSATAEHLRHFISHHRSGKRSASIKGSKAPRKSLPESLIIEGARENNLKNISLTLPLRQVVALTGLSGSGKSTIAKDIIYAEGQRRYLDCLSPYARQFINELKKPEIDSIQNVQPTVCVYQHTFQPGQLSTVATMSEVYNFLRLLFAKAATQYCPKHPARAISTLSASEIASDLQSSTERPVRILAPIVKSKKGLHKPLFQRAAALEIHEVRVDGRFAPPLQFSEGLSRNKAHTIEYTVARCNPSTVEPSLLEEAINQALHLGAGTIIVHDGESDQILSTDRTCPICRTGFFKPDPEDLSFSSRRGRCEECDGSGRSSRGSVCSACGGSRLGPIGRNLRLQGTTIAELCALTAPELLLFLQSLTMSNKRQEIAAHILPELCNRLQLLVDFGLGYIHLNRECLSLSGGELQRLRLAAAIGTSMTGAMYIFDEPSAGLHPLDNDRIIDKFRSLQELGNSVVLIEHDPTTVCSADHIVEVGPGAGHLGGQIVHAGTPDELLAIPDSLTSTWLREPFPESPAPKPSAVVSHTLTIQNGTCNNVRALSLNLPLRSFIGVAGVSGAGKSSLVHGIICRLLLEGSEQRAKTTWKLGEMRMHSSEPIEKVLVVDQKPIGINSRSTPASYLGIWDHIRKIFASSVEAKSRGITHSHFSYNTGAGRCPTCKGLGELALEMSFLAQARVPCDDCRGLRFTEATRSILYRDKSISDVLRMTFEEARSYFANHDRIHRVLHRACELGLGYLTLGQSSTTLSGGESQRIKLVSELSARSTGGTLYVLDEPSTGLHRADVARLIRSLHELVALGNTIIVIEHDPDLLLSADYLVEMGPGPGEDGGTVVFKGHPTRLREAKTPWGRVLRGAQQAVTIASS